MILIVDAWYVNDRMRAGPILFDTEALICIAPQPSGQKGPTEYYELFLHGKLVIGVKPETFQQIVPYLHAQWRHAKAVGDPDT